MKRAPKQALRALGADPESGIPLVRKVAGLRNYRVRRFRIVYAIDRTRRVVRILAVGHGRDVYEAMPNGLER